MARLRKDRFNELVSLFPEFYEYLKRHSNHYNYKRKNFLFEAFRKVSYLEEASKETRNRLLYEMDCQILNKGDILHKPGDDTDYFYIVENGCMEYFCYLEGNEFIMEFLS